MGKKVKPIRVEQTITPKRAKTRQRVLEAALGVFAKDGIDGASIEMITDAAGYSRGAFYSNFDSKEELFLELAQRQIEMRIEGAAKAVEELGQGLYVSETFDSAKVAQLFGAIIGNSEAERQWYIVMVELDLFALRHPVLGRRVVELNDHYRDEVTRVIFPLLEAFGLSFHGDPEVITRLLLTGYFEASKQAFMDADRSFEEALAHQVEWFIAMIDRVVRPA